MKKNKISLFAEDTILYFKNSNRFQQELLEMISALVGYKISTQKSMAFLYISNERICRKHRSPCAPR